MIYHKPRFFIFLAFCLSFCVVATTVLLYVYGYRFSLERGIFIYSGSISVKPTPEEVTIRINGEEVPPNKAGILNQSYLISGLLPGKHVVEVSAPGYHSWAKDVIVRSGLSTEFWNVFLVEQNIGKSILKESEGTRQIYPAPKSPTLFIYTKATAEGTEILLADTDEDDPEEKTLAKLAGWSLLDQKEKENVEWSPSERYVAVPVTRGGVRDTAIITVKKEKVQFLSELTGKTDLRSIRWNPEEKSFLFYREGNALFQTDITNTELQFTSKFDDTLAYDLSEDELFYLKKDGLVYRTALDAENEVGAITVTKETLPVEQDNLFTLIAYNQTRFTLQDEDSGELWLYNRFGAEVFYDHLLKKDAKGTQFSNDGKKLLYYTDTQAFVYYLRDWKVQPVRARGDIQPVLRLASPILYPQWNLDYEHIIFVSDGKLKIIELDNREAQYIQDIARFDAPLLQFLPRFTENKLYFVVTPEGAPSRVESIDFPRERPSFLENLVQ
jgi:hypothetical protein